MKKAHLVLFIIMLLLIITACSNPISQTNSSDTSSRSTNNQVATELVDSLFIRSCIKDISLNGESVSILTNLGKAYLWGKNENGTIGNGTTQDVATPYLIQIDATISQISASEYNSIALTDIGELYAWGSNEYGEFGNGTYEGSLVPKKLKLNFSVSKIETNDHITILLTTDGDVYWSGWNFDVRAFELDEPDLARYSNPSFTKVDLPAKIVDISVSSNGVALLAEHEVYYHGRMNSDLEKTNQDDSFVKVEFPVKIIKAKTSDGCLIALGIDQKLYGFGRSVQNFVGPNFNAALKNPSPIQGYENITDFSLGNNCLLAITDKGTILGAGYNIFNQITATQAEPADSEYIFEPFEIILDDKVTKVFCGYVSSAAITESGDCYLWGANYYNQLLNHNTNTPYTKGTPVRITTG